MKKRIREEGKTVDTLPTQLFGNCGGDHERDETDAVTGFATL